LVIDGGEWSSRPSHFVLEETTSHIHEVAEIYDTFINTFNYEPNHSDVWGIGGTMSLPSSGQKK
jgi:hypothetical protein